MAAIAAPGPDAHLGQTDSHGVESYYQQKLDEIDLKIRERSENLQRLRAQRNELNSKGTCIRWRVDTDMYPVLSSLQSACCEKSWCCFLSLPAVLVIL